MNLCALFLLGVSVPSGAAPSVPQEPGAPARVAQPDSEWTDWADWAQALRPSADELRWEQIPWALTLAEGVRRANEERLPVLFWAMNGHPLGCT